MCKSDFCFASVAVIGILIQQRATSSTKSL